LNPLSVLLAGTAATIIASSPLRAQRVDDATAGVVSARMQPATEDAHTGPRAQQHELSRVTSEREKRPSPWWAPLASAAMPGTGQALFRQDRWLPYLAIEAFAWFQYAASRAEAQRQSRSYRSLARDVAQAPFGATREGDFDYYERMKHFSESGVYDLVPGGDIEPEIDTLTSNGALWLLARRTYWADPDMAPDPTSLQYGNALTFYATRAVGPGFRYSWRNAQFEHDVFRRTIDRSNDAYRRSVEYLGAVLANHVLSTVDAYVTLRLQRRPPEAGSPGGGLELSGSLPWPGTRRGSATRSP
jgi:hypothetical protein